MAKDGKRSPADRWYQVRIARKRGLRRSKRRYKRYSPRLPIVAHTPEINPRYERSTASKFRGTHFIHIPQRLDCEADADWEMLTSLLKEIKRAALDGHYRRVVLNFHEVQAMAPEAAVTIVAEIQRCSEYCDPRTTITGTYPASPEVASLLTDLGFFKALDIRVPALPKAFQRRSYVQIERHNSTVAEIADELLDCFSEVFPFDTEDRKRLHVALVESMDNVFEHAYLPASTDPDLVKEWWLAGYADKVEGTISFTFYDQGAGIPTTIRARKKDRLPSYVGRWTDGQWISRALSKGVSRHASKRRGHGLMKLKEFIEGLDVEGSLRVVANHGLVTFQADGSGSISNIAKDLHGTLVSWQLRGISVQVPDQQSGEKVNAA